MGQSKPGSSPGLHLGDVFFGVFSFFSGATARERCSVRKNLGDDSGFRAVIHTQTLHGTAIYAYIGVVLGVNVGIYGNPMGLVWDIEHGHGRVPIAFHKGKAKEPSVRSSSSSGFGFASQTSTLRGNGHGSGKPPV